MHTIFMKTTIYSEHLGNMLQALARVPAKNASQPYLAYLLMNFSGSECVCTAHAVGFSAQYKIPLTSPLSQSFVIALDAVILSGFVSTVAKTDIVLELVDTMLVCKVGSSIVEIKTVDATELKPLEKVDGTLWYDDSSSDFSTLLSRVSFACASTDIRPELSAVYLYSKNNFLISVATDSFTLMEYRTPYSCNESCSVLLPNRYIADIIRIIALFKVVKVTLSDGALMIEADNSVVIVCRTIQGSYPDYEQIVPKQQNYSFETSREELKSALRIIYPFTNPQFPKVEIHPDSESGMCTFVTDLNEKGRGSASFRVLMTGDAYPIKINASSLEKVMQSLAVQRMVVSCVDPNKPIMISSPDDTVFRCLLMPIGR
jgi:DNA polymerase-3 subunit beta